MLKMKRTLVLAAIMVLAALLVFGCSRNNQTGYAAYGQQNPSGQQQGYVGGGCGVAGPEPTEIPEFVPGAAA